MPVTFTVAEHEARAVHLNPRPGTVRSLDDFLRSCAPTETRYCSEIFQNSFKNEPDIDRLRVMHNGFVDTVIQAYNGHHHLIIRPDDVWMCILSQFSIYVNAHAEDLRSHFVAHEGQEHIEIYTVGDRYSVPFDHLAQQFTQQMEKFIVDKDLSSWILPTFSTSTPVDTAIYAIQMMATLKQYFSYGVTMTCGIPSVTLLGVKDDWQDLLDRIPKLAKFGPEPTQWANLLTPILSRFVDAFDGNPNLDFWGRVAHHYNMGSGPTYLSGWITAFCPWNAKGVWMPKPVDASVKLNPVSNERAITVGVESHYEGRNLILVIDGVSYPIIDSSDVPHAYCDVPIHYNDNGDEFDAIAIAGHLASRVVNSGDTIQPAPGWFIFIKDTGAEEEVARKKAQFDRELSEARASGNHELVMSLYTRQMNAL